MSHTLLGIPTEVVGQLRRKTVSRRHFLTSFALAVTCAAFFPKLVWAKNKPVEFEWRVPKVHYETVHRELAFDGNIKPEVHGKGLPLVYLFVGIALLPSLSKAILALVREIQHGGVVIDACGEKLVIDTDKRLPGGIIVLKTKKDTQLFQRNDIQNFNDLATLLVKTMK